MDAEGADRRVLRRRPGGQDDGGVQPRRRRGRVEWTAGGEPWSTSFAMNRYFAAPAAACSISFATTSGWEMNATWLDLTSLVFAFIRLA